MIRSRFIFCALAIGLVVAGGGALDRAWQGGQGEDEGAPHQIVNVDIAPSVQTRPVKFGRAPAFVLTHFSKDRKNREPADRGVRSITAGGHTLLSLHTLLIE